MSTSLLSGSTFTSKSIVFLFLFPNQYGLPLLSPIAGITRDDFSYPTVHISEKTLPSGDCIFQ
ncbi:hypothetical protein PUN28_012280 [Cardiocondyla obscurior]|uniref:Uncharacterized protein n=1 Tax=Cardiocondyla obscurior TaxID=286306 RepID=A0AAW2FDT0_9HYME